MAKNNLTVSGSGMKRFNSMFNNPRPVYGYISAAGFLQSVLGCLTMVIANAIVRKMDRESALF